jgi:hypothetical protein
MMIIIIIKKGTTSGRTLERDGHAGQMVRRSQSIGVHRRLRRGDAADGLL